MIRIPNCAERDCEHLQGVKDTEDEANQIPVCEAFPDGIPDEIAYGDNPHTEPLENQDNDIVYKEVV